MAINERLRKRIDDIQGTVDEEKAWWDKRRATIQSEFMKELDDEEAEKRSEDDAVLVDAGTPAPTVPSAASTPAGTPSGKKKKGKK
jgi:translocation protein SEC66